MTSRSDLREFNDEMTVKQARDKLRVLAMAEGHKCPVCTQLTKVYKRKLNYVPAAVLITLYRVHGQEWAHVPSIVRAHLPSLAHQGGYATLSGYWGLVEEETEIKRDDGGRAGYWRVTEKGVAFIRREVYVPKYAYIFDGRCLKLDGGPVYIGACLGTKFDYNELMGELAGAAVT